MATAAHRLRRARALIPADIYAADPHAAAANENRQDRPFPARLQDRRIYEVAAAAQGDAPAAMGFALALMAGRASAAPLLFCQTAQEAQEFGRPYAPGLAAFGLGRRLLYAEAADERQLLWVSEEAVVSAALAGVVARLPVTERLYGFTESRRLALRAHRAGTPAVLLRSRHAQGATAAASRWRVAAAPSAEAGYRPPFGPEGLGATRWQVDCERSRDGRPGRWLVEWDHETHRLHMVEAVRDRPGQARTAG